MALQVVVSLLRLEIPPLLSTYDMYATTYGSPAEYEQKAGQAYWIIGVDERGAVPPCRITRADADALPELRRPTLECPAIALMRRCFDPSLDIRTCIARSHAGAHRLGTGWERLDEPIRRAPYERDPAGMRSFSTWPSLR